MKNTLSDLNNYLFEAIERINDDDLSDEELLRYANQGNVVERLFGVEVWNQAMAKIEE